MLFLLAPAHAQVRHHYDFDESQLSAEWQFLGKPDMSKYVLRDGKLRLYGDIFEVKEHETTTFLALPQRDRQFVAETRIVTFDDDNGDEAGLCLFRSDSCFAQLLLGNYRNEHRLRLRFQLKSHNWIMAERHMTRRVDEIWLRIACDGQFYRFFFSTNGKDFEQLDAIECSLMSPLIAGSEAPALIGPYAFTGTTKYQMGYAYADFDYFDYQGQ